MRLRLASFVALPLAAAIFAGCAHSPEPAARAESPGSLAAASQAGAIEKSGEAAAVESPSAPAKPAEPLPITFEDLDIGMEADSVYEPWMLTTSVKSLIGKRVRITGFMSAAILQGSDTIRTFPLLREKECPFGPGGRAHHVIEVELQGKLRTNFRREPVTVEGVLSVQPWNGPNGKTWSLYHLEGTKIE
jgi:hypothetical protein